MFQYLTAKQHHKVATRIGNYVSHFVVKGRSIQDLNDLDRYHLAEGFINSERVYLSFLIDKQVIDSARFLEDIAKTIDQRIPQAFVKWRDKRGDVAPSKIYVRAAELGIMNSFQENADSESERMNELRDRIEQDGYATKKQIIYLKDLIADTGYILKVPFSSLSSSDAHQLINFFTKDIDPGKEAIQLLEYDVRSW